MTKVRRKVITRCCRRGITSIVTGSLFGSGVTQNQRLVRLVNRVTKKNLIVVTNDQWCDWVLHQKCVIGIGLGLQNSKPLFGSVSATYGEGVTSQGWICSSHKHILCGDALCQVGKLLMSQIVN